MNVISLADHCNGLSPALRNSFNALQAEVLAAVNTAMDASVPLGLIVAELEFVKAAIIHQQFAKVEASQ